MRTEQEYREAAFSLIERFLTEEIKAEIEVEKDGPFGYWRKYSFRKRIIKWAEWAARESGAFPAFRAIALHTGQVNRAMSLFPDEDFSAIFNAEKKKEAKKRLKLIYRGAI